MTSPPQTSLGESAEYRRTAAGILQSTLQLRLGLANLAVGLSTVAFDQSTTEALFAYSISQTCLCLASASADIPS